MLVSTDIIDNIDDIVEQAYLDFTHELIGDDYFTEEQQRQIEALGLLVGRKPVIELIYLLARQRSTPGYRKDRTLNQLLNEVSNQGVLPVINDAHKYSIEHAKTEINNSIEDTKQEIRNKVKQEILKVNDNYRNEVVTEGVTSLPEQEEKRESYLGELLVGLGVLGVGIKSNFVRQFTNHLTGLVNNATVDEATTMTPAGQNVLVYKQVVNDGSLCPWCEAFYLNEDGTPKIYKLRDIQKNGSNIGKPKSAWKPVVGPTHPRCRCQLEYLTDQR